MIRTSEKYCYSNQLLFPATPIWKKLAWCWDDWSCDPWAWLQNLSRGTSWVTSWRAIWWFGRDILNFAKSRILKLMPEFAERCRNEDFAPGTYFSAHFVRHLETLNKYPGWIISTTRTIVPNKSNFSFTQNSDHHRCPLEAPAPAQRWFPWHRTNFRS